MRIEELLPGHPLVESSHDWIGDGSDQCEYAKRIEGHSTCPRCMRKISEHAAVNSIDSKYIACPGDVIFKSVSGEVWVDSARGAI